MDSFPSKPGSSLTVTIEEASNESTSSSSSSSSDSDSPTPTPKTPNRNRVSFRVKEDSPEKSRVSSIRENPFQAQSSTTTNSTLNIGIYFEDGQITVAVTDGKSLDKIKTFSPDICFSEEKIIIGKRLENIPIKFHIYALLKEPPNTPHAFTLMTSQFTLSTEEIIALYFQRLLQKSKEIQGAVSISNIVISTPFPISSLERERLKWGLHLAGYNRDLSFYSSILTTAVWHVIDQDHYDAARPRTEWIFVVQALKYTFSMGVVQVSQRGVALRSCIVSENLIECQDQAFYEGHGQTFSEEGKHREIVFTAYKAGVDQVLCDVNSQPIDRVVGVTKPRNRMMLEKIMSKFFSANIILIYGVDEPLHGACLLASKALLPDKSFPPDIYVREAFRSNLMVTVGSQKYVNKLRNRGLTPGLVSSFDVLVPPAQGQTTVTVLEEYFRGAKTYTAGTYQLLAKVMKPEKKPEGKNRVKTSPKRTAETPVAKCFLEVDSHGIFRVQASFSEKLQFQEKLFRRVDEPVRGVVSEDLKLMEKFYRQEFRLETSERRNQQDLAKQFRNDAVLFYSMSMKTFNPKNKTEEEIREEHERVKTEARERFVQNCEKNGLDGKKESKHLDSKIDGVFDEVKNFFANSRAKINDWFTKLSDKMSKKTGKKAAGKEEEDLQKRFDSLQISDPSDTSSSC